MDYEEYVDLNEFDHTDWRQFDLKKWTTKKQSYRNHIQACWGKFPSTEHQESVFMGEEIKDGYKIEKYELMVSATGHTLDDFIPIWIFIPDKMRETPCPTMIIHHQHAGQFHLGKKEPAGIEGNPDQFFAIHLVKRGYVVAVFDALGFEDRQEEGGEKYIFTRLMMYGMTLNGKFCFDTSQVLTFLQNRKYVAKDRIGIMGHSLGGVMAIWSAVFDPRIKLIVSSCGIGRLGGPNSILAHHIDHCFAVYLPNILDPTIGMDMQEVIGLIHPKPLILSNGAMDTGFPIDGVAEIHNWVEKLYQSSENQANLITLRHVGNHRTPETSRKIIYKFIEDKL
jgi:dienelactone hydrolase